MFHTIKTLLSQGKSQRSIAKELGISRKTVRRIQKSLLKGDPPDPYVREKKLETYRAQIEEWLGSGLSGVLIHRRLGEEYDLAVSYGTVRRMVNELKGSEVYVPLTTAPGEEVQVDFGYVGLFERDGRKVKVWVFCMLLSHSRYGYYEVVTDQSIPTFLRCHQHGFEYFGGVSQWVKLDNLKAGVLKPDFYEPLIQAQYAEFLAYYRSAAMPTRVRRPQDKGKVESGIKYVKNNFIKGLTHQNWDQLVEELARWNGQVCNQRLHGTTRKVPLKVFTQVEKPHLLSLPAHRYEIYRVEQRKVNRMGHITFACNYYSVPHIHVGKTLEVRSNGRLLKVLDQGKEVALHQLAQDQGQYITQESHKPPGKQSKDPEYYREKLRQIGPHALALMQILHQQDHHWRAKIRGILNLRRFYPPLLIDKACERALEYQSYSYLTVKRICEKGLVEVPDKELLPTGMGGFGHDLAHYDQLTS